MAKYSGPAFPLKRQLRNGSTEFLLECMHRALSGDLRNDLTKRVEEIRAKGTAGRLGPVGVQEELSKLRGEFEAKITTEGWGHPAADSFDEFLGRARKRVADLTEKLIAPRKPDHEPTAAELVEAGFQRHRVITRHERLEPAQQRAAIARACESASKGDEGARVFLRALRGEVGLLDAATAARIDAALMAGSDPGAFAELNEFLGPMTNGEHDPLGGALPVVEFALAKFREFADELCGTNSEVEAARAKLMKQIEANPKAPVVLSAEEGRDARLYQLAKSIAQEHNRILSVEGGGSLDVAATGNGSGQ
jgi:hypothetical protein